MKNLGRKLVEKYCKKRYDFGNYYYSVSEWEWHFPGWTWVSLRLNKEFKNNRTPEACRKMASKLGLTGC